MYKSPKAWPSNYFESHDLVILHMHFLHTYNMSYSLLQYVHGAVILHTSFYAPMKFTSLAQL